MTKTTYARTAPVLLLWLLSVFASEGRAAIYLNEVVVRGPERVEIYNDGPGPVLLDGWILRGSAGDFLIPDGITIVPGEYRVFDALGGIMNDIGGDLDLIDDLKSRSDRVQYGQGGGAPLPHDAPLVSLCRAPDAATSPPLDPASDANFWTLDLSSTFGTPNNAPPPALGSSLLINELDPNGGGGFVAGDNVEIYNPTGASIITGGWFMTFGAGSTVPITFSDVPPGLVSSMKLPPDIDLEVTLLAYLFDDAGVRVDQLGWSGVLAARGEQFCVGRCPDGAGPNDGYDAESSGAGESLFEVACTIGSLNPVDCRATPVVLSSWGWIKSFHRVP